MPGARRPGTSISGDSMQQCMPGIQNFGHAPGSPKPPREDRHAGGSHLLKASTPSGSVDAEVVDAAPEVEALAELGEPGSAATGIPSRSKMLASSKASSTLMRRPAGAPLQDSKSTVKPRCTDDAVEHDAGPSVDEKEWPPTGEVSSYSLKPCAMYWAVSCHLRSPWLMSLYVSFRTPPQRASLRPLQAECASANPLCVSSSITTYTSPPGTPAPSSPARRHARSAAWKRSRNLAPSSGSPSAPSAPAVSRSFSNQNSVPSMTYRPRHASVVSWRCIAPLPPRIMLRPARVVRRNLCTSALMS
mmetsp:Transcript_17712/g.50169  ORF Transcript_17712/g.50169 Transcript_17712/m.50169 type:complete len:303 (-) Transcript_17712:781-1689(-)